MHKQVHDYPGYKVSSSGDLEQAHSPHRAAVKSLGCACKRRLLVVQDPADSSCLLFLFSSSSLPFPSPEKLKVVSASTAEPASVVHLLAELVLTPVIDVYLHHCLAYSPIPKQGSATRFEKPGRERTFNKKASLSLCSNTFIQSLHAQVYLLCPPRITRTERFGDIVSHILLSGNC